MDDDQKATAAFRVGDKVRVKHPTGGVLASDVFTVVEEPSDARFPNMVWIDGEWGWPKRSGRKPMGFDPGSLEHVAPDLDVKAECICHRLGPDYAIVNCPVHGRIERPDEPHICTCGDCESEAFSDRCKFELALRELDDGHGLGKEGLDTAREVVEDAVWFPLNRMSMGDRKDDAWLVSADKMRALAVAIGMKDEL